MGEGITLRCHKCGYERAFCLGIGFGFPGEYKKLVEEIRAGKYGEEWKCFYAVHPGAAINAERELYQCKACNHLEEEHNLSLYDNETGEPPEYGYWMPWDKDQGRYRFVKSYPHHCPKCGKRMRKITMFPNSLSCPECGETMKLDPALVLWD